MLSGRTFAKNDLREPFTPLNWLWVPSQKGLFALFLHPQKNTFLDSVAVNFFGANSEPA